MELTSLSGFLAVLTVVISAAATLLLSSLKTLRDTAGDLRLRIGDLEVKVTALTAENVTLKHDRDALARQIRGDDNFVKLDKKIDAVRVELTEHHKEVMAASTKIIGLLAGIVDELSGGKP